MNTMAKRSFLIFLGLMLISLSIWCSCQREAIASGESSASSPTILIFDVGKSNYLVNSKSQTMDAEIAPVIIENRALLPIKFVIEPLGGSVSWDGTQKKVTIVHKNTTIELWVGKPTARINGQDTPIDSVNPKVTPLLTKGRTFLPMRFVVEAIGASVSWNSVTRQATVTYPKAIDNTQTDKVQEVSQFETVKGIPKLRLNNGNTYSLVNMKESEEMGQAVIIQSTPVPMSVIQYTENGTPTRVDLRRWQTPMRDQAGRGTCVTHAITAAIEARYKRLDPVRYNNLDLSEQYGNHLQKMVHLKSALPGRQSWRENQLGAWGGGNTFYSAALFLRYRLPVESLLPYIPDYGYEATTEPGDNPFIDWEDESGLQSVVNDFNLSTTNLPNEAIWQARYGITSYNFVPTAVANDPSYYEAILAAGYEVAFMLELYNEASPGDRIWNPGATPGGGHAMLMVGYDHNRQVFIVKNSWNYDNPDEQGFTLVSYDYIRRSASNAVYITGVEPNPDTNYASEQAFLGRWKMDHDGWQGTLDIYRLPHLFRADEIGGQEDKRIGSYTDHNGNIYRVNGVLNGNRLELYINRSRPNANYGETQGQKFTAYIFSKDKTFMAGTLLDTDGRTYGFYATKGTYISGNPAAGTTLDYSSYIGTWYMGHDGWIGRLNITGVSSSGSIIGTYTGGGGQVYSIAGSVNSSNKRKIHFTIPFDSSSPQPFDGYMHSWEKGLISGTTVWNGSTFGFIAYRR